MMTQNTAANLCGFYAGILHVDAKAPARRCGRFHRIPDAERIRRCLRCSD